MWEQRRADSSLKLKMNAILTLFDETGNFLFYVGFKFLSFYMTLFICFIEINNSFIININFCNYESK